MAARRTASRPCHGDPDLGFLAAVRLTHAALPAMLEAGWGRIVHVSSATVYEPNPDLFLSSSVRPAVAGFSKSLAREVAPAGQPPASIAVEVEETLSNKDYFWDLA